MIREDNKYLNKTITYAYDLGGNLTTVKEYAYQTGASVSGTATQTNSYTYGDANWKDKLTKYNGTTISYDSIGNPLNYYNGYTFTWLKGRQLATANNGTNAISFSYNSDGIRTSKTVNGTTTSYVLEGSKVVFETDGSSKIWYYYNASGAPVAFRIGSVLYIYRKNLQGQNRRSASGGGRSEAVLVTSSDRPTDREGMSMTMEGDITGIYSREGNLLVSYSYDAWGQNRRSAACGG